MGKHSLISFLIVEIAVIGCRIEVLGLSIPVGNKAGNDLDQILEGVEEISCGECAPGMIAVFGENAFAIAAGYYHGHQAFIPFGAASRDDNGRIVAFGHIGRPLEDSNRITLNSILWAGQQSSRNLTKVGVYEYPPVLDFLNENNFIAESIPTDTFENLDKLMQYNVIAIPNMHGLKVNETVIGNLKTYIKSGGGFVAACTPWSLETSFDGFGNRIIRDSGMIWVPMNMNANYNTTNFEISKDILEDSGCPKAAEELRLTISGTIEFNPVRISQLQGVVNFCLENVPQDHLLWLSSFQETVFDHTPAIPLKDPTDLQRLQINLENGIRNGILENQPPHPSSEIFPGSISGVPGSITFTDVLFRKGQRRFHTGRYAGAGEAIKLQIQGTKSCTVRIGCHTDHLTKKQDWARFPIISNKHQFNSTFGSFSSGFGGLIYIEDIEFEDPDSPMFSITIDGSFETPTYILGQTKDWETVRKVDAPFAEMVGKQVVLSVPGKDASRIDDPQLLMEFWDRVLEMISDLTGISFEENFQQFAFDIDISAGYMHSGYPIMAFLHSAQIATNLTTLMNGTRSDDIWGFFHELGHNHQKRHWTFEEGGEVTCNLFAMYVLNTYHGIPLSETRPSIFSPKNIQIHLKPYIENGCNYFTDFIYSEGAKHLFYYQLITCHGWESFKGTFRAYNELDQNELPIDADDIRDKWLILFSQSSGYNIGPLMRSWGIPITEQAEEIVKDLPLSKCRITDLIS